MQASFLNETYRYMTMPDYKNKNERFLARAKSDFFFYSVNSKGEIAYVSESIVNILGYCPEEGCAEFHRYLTNSSLNKTFPEMAARPDSVSPEKDHPAFQVEVLTKEGDIRQLLLSEILLFDEHNKFQGIYGIAVNTTEHYLKEQKLSTNERKLKLAERLARFGHWNLNLVTGELLWSEDIFSMFGLVPKKFGASYEAFLDCIHPDDRDYVNQRFTEALEYGESYEAEHRLIRKSDQEVRMVSEFCEFICDDDGKPIRAMGVVQDITQARKAELDKLAWEETRYTSLIETIDAVAATLAFRDPYTAGHQKRVSQLAVMIGQELGLDAKTIEGVKLGAMLHDIGKVMVPMEILNRPGRLSKPELEIIKTHPTVGYDIVEKVEFIWPIREMILQHHERLDGSGYPNGISGDEIILEARIIAVADVTEAITSHRPYRPALGADKAIEILKEGRGSAFDSTIVDICIKLIQENTIELNSGM